MITLMSLLFFMCSLLGFMVVTQGYEGAVTASYGDIAYTLTLTHAVTYGVLLVLGCLYLGQFIGWLGGMASRLRGEKAKHGLALVTDAWAQNLLGNTQAANKLLNEAQPKLSHTEQPLADLLRSQTTDEETTLQAMAGSGNTGAVIHMRMALLAAARENWNEAKLHTTQGLAQNQTSPYLQMLHLKALLNTNDMAAAAALLPNLKPMVGTKTWSLLQRAVKGPAAQGKNIENQAPLSHPWLKTFKSWLGTTSVKLPEA